MRDLLSYINAATDSELRLLLANVEQRLAGQGPSPAIPRALRVAEGAKHLNGEQLEAATASFAVWREAALTPAHSRSRARVWLAFLLIRYGAMRLGEVLVLDDEKDIHTDRAEQPGVDVHGPNARKVLLPEPVLREIAGILAQPMFYGMRGKVLHLDPGYLRRKFYERAKACHLPAELLNPRVLRHSRAIELLRGGVPMQAVQSFLGGQNLSITANYLDFSESASNRFVQQYITREVKMKTSARNAFTGRVTRIVRDSLLVEIELTTISGLKVVAVITDTSHANLRLEEGSVATATVKAPWVILALPEDELKTSARNSFPGTVSEVKRSEIAAEAVVDLADGTKVCALITRESADKLGLMPGVKVLAMFKAFSVILNVE